MGDDAVREQEEYELADLMTCVSMSNGEGKLPLAPAKLESQVQTGCCFATMDSVDRCHGVLLGQWVCETLGAYPTAIRTFIVSDRGRHPGFPCFNVAKVARQLRRAVRRQLDTAHL